MKSHLSKSPVIHQNKHNVGLYTGGGKLRAPECEIADKKAISHTKIWVIFILLCCFASCNQYSLLTCDDNAVQKVVHSAKKCWVENRLDCLLPRSENRELCYFLIIAHNMVNIIVVVNMYTLSLILNKYIIEFLWHALCDRQEAEACSSSVRVYIGSRVDSPHANNY